MVCFYPWLPFQATGAWVRFSSLWKYLLQEGAEVTIALLDKGNNIQLRQISVQYLGENPAVGYSDAPTLGLSASTVAEWKQFSSQELDVLVRYEKKLYLQSAKTGPWLDELISSHDLVTCDYPFYAPLLSEYCKKWTKPLVVTSLDLLYELHGKHPKAKERLKQNEIQALKLADALVFCNDNERIAFAEHGLTGVTVMNTGDARGVMLGNEDNSKNSIRAAFKLTTAQYCLFVGSSHAPNIDAATEMRNLAKEMPELTFIVVGTCCAKAADKNFIALGQVTDEFLDTLYRGAFAVLIPLVRGTGGSIKTYQAFAYGKAVVSTPVGARGFTLVDGQELILAERPRDFPATIRRLMADEALHRKISTAAREYALKMDYREHFKPYSEIIQRLVAKPTGSMQEQPRTLILVDNNLSNRVGHHFNYALALKEECVAQGSSYIALVKQGAPADVLSELSACGVFSQGIHEELSQNPYPVEWGSIRSVYDFLQSNENFSKELEAGLKGRARPSDTVFLPNATPRQMLGLALFLHRNPICGELNFVLIFRYSVYFAVGPLAERKTGIDKEAAERYAMAIDRLNQVDKGRKIRLATDSVELAKEYETIAKRPIEVLPIPHTISYHPGSLPVGMPAKGPNRKRIIYLGDAREEKGFELLEPLVRACGSNALKSSTEFVFQAFTSSSYHHKMELHIEALAAMKQPNLHLMRDPLSSDEYHALLESADLVLLPYDMMTYRARTSGPFVEAICANKAVVVPRNSWMSIQLGQSQAGVAFNSGNPQDFVRAVVGALANINVHRAAAEELGKQFREFHNPRAFVKQLMRTG